MWKNVRGGAGAVTARRMKRKGYALFPHRARATPARCRAAAAGTEAGTPRPPAACEDHRWLSAMLLKPVTDTRAEDSAFGC